MLKSREYLLSGLKKIEDLDKGLYPKTSGKIKEPKLKIDFTQILSLEKKLKITNHDDLQDHDDMDSEYDEIILPENDDMFDKTEVNVNIATNVALINTFPNALLLEESIFNKNDKEKENQENKEIEKEPEKEENIWDILNKMQKENNSEALDNLTTESEAKITNNTENNEDDDNDDGSMKNKTCKACGSKGSLIEDQHASVLVCSKCGMVNEELLDHGPEWRQYNNDDNRGEGVNRCGCPSNFFFPKSSQGTIMAGSSNSRLKRKQKWNSMVYKERSLNQVFEYISHICSKNNIPKIIIDDAKIFYKNLSDCKHKSGVNAGKQIIIRGENRLSIIAACVFKACEKNKNPRSTKEIAEFFGLEEKKVTKGNKQFDKIMKNADDKSLMLDQYKDTDTAEDYIRRHCPKLKINKNDTDIAVRIAHNCCKMKLASDHNPQSIAAGSILVMVQYCNLNIDKKDIAKLFGTSDVTIGKIYNKIAPFADALVDDDATEHLIKKFRING
ncbi:putative transcription initiation factor IIb-like protein [Tupanvirus soda lake]|uniref:Transcription initiation factor IIb-like protein n=2 Tax=Tupanvirus TaxID=2094720 RepID=A0AC62ACM1_9VIRU|nr:putative transcription initiation factor IIb-like protein [Tupanvirus soda lake]QKU35541.1 putative transcription initiation factor IIb-like protein [Tupanvirus soda lake]